MKCSLTIGLLFCFCFGSGQYKQVPLTIAEIKTGVLRHYQLAEMYASVEIYILPGMRFRFQDHGCSPIRFSEGSFRETEKEIIFTSDLQKETLPGRAENQNRKVGDSLVKRIAPLHDSEVIFNQRFAKDGRDLEPIFE